MPSSSSMIMVTPHMTADSTPATAIIDSCHEHVDLAGGALNCIFLEAQACRRLCVLPRQWKVHDIWQPKLLSSLDMLKVA